MFILFHFLFSSWDFNYMYVRLLDIVPHLLQVGSVFFIFFFFLSFGTCNFWFIVKFIDFLLSCVQPSDKARERINLWNCILYLTLFDSAKIPYLLVHVPFKFIKLMFNFPIRFFYIIIVILKSMSDSSNNWVIESGSVDCFISLQWVILSCVSQIFDCMPDIWCRKPVGTEVTSIYIQKKACLFCQAISLHGWVNLLRNWAGFWLCFCYHFLQYTTDFRFLYLVLCVGTGVPGGLSQCSCFMLSFCKYLVVNLSKILTLLSNRLCCSLLGAHDGDWGWGLSHFSWSSCRFRQGLWLCSWVSGKGIY